MAALGLLLLTILSSPADADPSALQVRIATPADDGRAGDYQSVTVAVTNAGTRPLGDVLVMLSLTDVTHVPAVPLSLEDWTPDPAAAHAARLGAGQRLSHTWRLRMIEAGRIAVYATAVADTGTVANSRPTLLTIEPARNLTPGRVWPVVLGVPFVLFSAVAATVRAHAARKGSRRGRDMPARGTPRTLLAIVVALTPAILLAIGASAADRFPSSATGNGLRPSLSIRPDITTAKTGDRLTVTASIRNTTQRVLTDATLFLGLMDATPGQPTPLGLETWTGDPESVALPALSPGASASARWRLVMIQPGALGLYASVMTGPESRVQSSRFTMVRVEDVRVLNPHRVLLVALGEPALLLALIWLPWTRRSVPRRLRQRVAE